AIWNDLDQNDETPGCLARRLKLPELYEAMVDAGVRAELLLNRLDEYEPLEEEDEDEEEDGAQPEEENKDEETEGTDDQAHQLVETMPVSEAQLAEITEAATAADPEVNNTRYLNSNLTFQNERLLDQDQNGVTMAWETDIMARSAKKLLPTSGLRVLNIG